MANITKVVNKGIPSAQRNQSWDSAVHLDDLGGAIGVGDIFRIEESLGRTAETMVITVYGAGSVSIRINPAYKVTPRRPPHEFGYASEYYDLVAAQVEAMDTSQNPITIHSGETMRWHKEQEVSTVEITAKTGDFQLTVT